MGIKFSFFVNHGHKYHDSKHNLLRPIYNQPSINTFTTTVWRIHYLSLIKQIIMFCFRMWSDIWPGRDSAQLQHKMVLWVHKGQVLAAKPKRTKYVHNKIQTLAKWWLEKKLSFDFVIFPPFIAGLTLYHEVKIVQLIPSFLWILFGINYLQNYLCYED